VPRTRTKKKETGEHIELQRVLVKRLITLIAIILILILTVTYATPLIGKFFGFLARNDGEQGDQLFKPNPPLLAQIPEATKEDAINITGYGQPGFTVKLFVNGPTASTNVIGSDGVFQFDGVKLISGRNTIFAKTVDKQGVESEKSSTYIVNVDKKAPKIEIEEPDNGETIRNLDKRIKIKGKINEKATILINGKQAIQKSDLTFEYLLGVSEGNVSIEVKATDVAGNEKVEKINVEYKKDN
jgi:hypothetical protein